MSDIIRQLTGPPSPNSNWVRSMLPHKPPQDIDIPGIFVDGVPPLPSGAAPGAGTGRPLFDPSSAPPVIEFENPYRNRSNGVFRDPDSYDNRT